MSDTAVHGAPEPGRGVLSALATRLPGMVAAGPVVPGDGPFAPDRWTSLDQAVRHDDLTRAIDGACRRWRTDDRVTAGSLLVREWTVAATSLAVAAWWANVGFDLSSANLAVRTGPTGSMLGVVDVTLVSPDVMIASLLDGAVADVIDGFVAVERIGPRHLWGNVALAVANDLASFGHLDPARADAGRDAFLSGRPEVTRTIEVVDLPDGLDPPGTITCAIRTTCCLLDHLDPALRCGTCSLNDRTDRVMAVARHFRAERARTRG